MTWKVYVLKCADGSYYTGVTKDLDARVESHNAGEGARYTAGRRPVELVYWELVLNKSEALKREAAIKRMTHADKEALGG